MNPPCSLLDTFNSVAEPLAGTGHHGLVQGGHHLGDLGLQGGLGAVRAFVDFPLTNAP